MIRSLQEESFANGVANHLAKLSHSLSVCPTRGDCVRGWGARLVGGRAEIADAGKATDS
jgi:hypothetical protein